MLLEFRVSNFRSFAQEQTLSMIASSDDSLEDTNIIETGGHRVVKSAALYGANGSGKTSLLEAMEFATKFVVNSATKMNLGDEIGVEPFRLSKDLMEEPSQFSFSLMLNGVRFDYGFSATVERVHGEWLTAYPKGRAQHWLTRSYDRDAGAYLWKCGGALGRELELLKSRTRENGLALSRAAENNVDPVKSAFLWFKDRVRFLDQSMTPDRSQRMRYSLGLFCRNEEFRSYVNQLISDADMGVEAVEVVQDDASEIQFPTATRDQMRELVQRFGKKDFVTWSATHKNHETGEAAEMTLELEAAGTKRLLALSGPWWDILQNGRTLVVDELDCSLHPHLVRKLIQLFHSPEHNQSGAQLVFATHDSTLLDLSLFRRDQIWFAEKQASGASKLFSLWDYRPRKGEAIQRGYLGGRYGAVPRFGRSLEGIE